MKKPVILCLFLCAASAFVFSQSRGGSPQVTADDVIKRLDSNFEKYPFVHLLIAEKTEDKRTPKSSLNTLAYQTLVADKFGIEKMEDGEVLYAQVIKNGWRYDVKLDFSPKKEKGTKPAQTVKNSLYKGVLNELREAVDSDKNQQ